MLIIKLRITYIFFAVCALLFFWNKMLRKGFIELYVDLIFEKSVFLFDIFCRPVTFSFLWHILMCHCVWPNVLNPTKLQLSCQTAETSLSNPEVPCPGSEKKMPWKSWSCENSLRLDIYLLVNCSYKYHQIVFIIISAGLGSKKGWETLMLSVVFLRCFLRYCA